MTGIQRLMLVTGHAGGMAAFAGVVSAALLPDKPVLPGTFTVFLICLLVGAWAVKD